MKARKEWTDQNFFHGFPGCAEAIPESGLLRAERPVDINPGKGSVGTSLIWEPPDTDPYVQGYEPWGRRLPRLLDWTMMGVGDMLFLFDYDGVIADSFDSLLNVCVEAHAALGEGRAPTPGDFRTIENLTFDELGRMIGIPEGRCAAYAEKVLEIQQKGWRARPFPGVVGVIPKLAVQHTVAVVTNSQSHVVAAALEEFGLGGAVTAVAGGELGTTKADRIAYLQGTHASTGERTYMIGDTIGDIRSGKQAGVRTIAVTWGFQRRDLLLKESPDYLADYPEALLAIAGGCVRQGAWR